MPSRAWACHGMHGHGRFWVACGLQPSAPLPPRTACMQTYDANHPSMHACVGACVSTQAWLDGASGAASPRRAGASTLALHKTLSMACRSLMASPGSITAGASSAFADTPRGMAAARPYLHAGVLATATGASSRRWSHAGGMDCSTPPCPAGLAAAPPPCPWSGAEGAHMNMHTHMDGGMRLPAQHCAAAAERESGRPPCPQQPARGVARRASRFCTSTIMMGPSE